jgi:molecular chaperone DnaK (HSP70)
MRLGIDFGTTRTVVAVVDRGNYPVVSFEDTEGATHDWFPPIIATRGRERLYGWEAWAAQENPEYTIIRSIKRTLEDAGPDTMVQVGEHSVPMQQILTEMACALKTALLEKSTVPGRRDEPMETMLGVPANANSNQRFLTVDPFQRVGFSVLGLLNEPSAASIEYGHKNRDAQSKERVLVYDLGGGTFDVSLVEIDGKTHSVIASEGIPALGGDDFDILLAELALDAADIEQEERESLTQAEIFRLHDECRVKKEALHPNTRKIVVDLGQVRDGWAPVSVPADEFYAKCRPLLDESIRATESLLAANEGEAKLGAVYITGGGSELPLVARMLKELFGRKVKRSAHTRSATAIGLAIQADEQAGYVLREGFTRHFGVWREAEAGRVMIFDPLFEKGTPLPGPGEPPLEISREYFPAHNIGHFRYLECSHLRDDGQPAGDLAVWDEILFPLDPALQDKADLAAVAVTRSPSAAHERIEERYMCDSGGSIAVEIVNHSSRYVRQYRLGRWAGKAAPVVPGKRKRAARR